MIKVLYTALRALLYYFTPLYKGWSKVVVKAQHPTTLNDIKVVVKQ